MGLDTATYTCDQLLAYFQCTQICNDMYNLKMVKIGTGKILRIRSWSKYFTKNSAQKKFCNKFCTKTILQKVCTKKFCKTFCKKFQTKSCIKIPFCRNSAKTKSAKKSAKKFSKSFAKNYLNYSAKISK
mgnify:CR=1 FL=1